MLLVLGSRTPATPLIAVAKRRLPHFIIIPSQQTSTSSMLRTLITAMKVNDVHNNTCNNNYYYYCYSDLAFRSIEENEKRKIYIYIYIGIHIENKSTIPLHTFTRSFYPLSTSVFAFYIFAFLLCEEGQITISYKYFIEIYPSKPYQKSFIYSSCSHTLVSQDLR